MADLESVPDKQDKRFATQLTLTIDESNTRRLWSTPQSKKTSTELSVTNADGQIAVASLTIDETPAEPSKATPTATE